MTITQVDRAVSLETPLGDDVLLFRQMTATEELGRPFELRIQALSEDFNIVLEDLLGERIAVRMESDPPTDPPRWFNGFVSSFSFVGDAGGLAAYDIVARPWFWLLTRNADCRIFQEKTVPEIIMEVFGDRGFGGEYDNGLTRTYRTWEFCVQYRETDFNFCSRLMEEEGIYYYFTHEEDKHTMKLADALASHGPPSDPYAEVPFFPPGDFGQRERDHVYSLKLRKTMQPGKVTVDDFDFKQPTLSLLRSATTPSEHAYGEFEVYEYPGGYVVPADGQVYADVRNQEYQANHERVTMVANLRGMQTGAIFTLTDYLRNDQNREYLIVGTRHELQSGQYETGGDGEEVFVCTMDTLESQIAFQSERTTTKPGIQGPQTATVVGPAGDEIYPDEFGRVKVQFHWDRYGQSDQNSSCWIRVSQPWAGKNWGSVSIPRIGQEVIIDFLEGDPDQPIITGRVYNGDNKPPYALPASGMVSGLKSNSTPGGGGYNEMSMNDTKGSEAITIHAQYDMATTVEHDDNQTVHNNRASTVDVDETAQVGGNQSGSVAGDRSLTVGGNQTTAISGNLDMNVGGTHDQTVTGNESLSVGGNQESSVSGTQKISVSATAELTVGATYKISANAPIEIKSAAMITLEAGGSKIVIGPDGVTIQTGAMVTVVGSMVKLN